MEQFAILLLCLGWGLVFIAPLYDALTRIAKGIKHMADLEAQAIADLKAAAPAVVALIQKLAADLASAQAAAGTPPVDHSAEIEGVVKQLADAVSGASAPAAPAAAPAVDPAPAAPAA